MCSSDLNETSGLSTDQVNRCQLQAYIPANAEYGSLNLAAAVQVLSYELRVTVHAAVTTTTQQARELASHEEIEGLYAQIERASLETGFINPDSPKKLMPKFRRLFARTQLEREEVNILRGLVRTLREPKSR
mgnify:FL=1